MQVLDLSVLLNERTPVFPGDQHTKIEQAGVLDRDGFNDHYVSIGTHVGTHIDAPAHMLKDGRNLAEIPAGQFVGRGRLIMAKEGFDLQAVEQSGIEPNDIVLFYTGTSERFYSPTYFTEYPIMTEEIARYLVDKKVRMVGVDTGNVDEQENMPIHKILLSAEVLIVENLTNLAQLQSKEFDIYALPLKFALDGSPARVIAVVK